MAFYFETMTLSIVIANWNTKELIKQCINSILDHPPTDKEFEIIVIDNGSTDGSLEYLETLREKIKLISNDVNRGYAAATNQGMKEAKGEFVLLLGSDTIMHEGTLTECMDFLRKNKNCGAVSCKLLNPDGSVQNNLKKFPRLRNAFFAYLSFDKLNRDYDMAEFKYDKSIIAEQIATTFFMTRRDLLKEVGYFDEAYRILYNDVDLCHKINDLGYDLCFLHTCSITHYGSHSTKNADFALRKKMYGDIYRYYKNYFGFKAKFLYPILVARLFIVSSIKA